MMIRFLAAAAAGVVALSGFLEAVGVDTQNRWLVRDYYNSVYAAGASAQIDWTGNYSSGEAGSVSPDWQTATLNRVKFFREMAGLPADVSFDPAINTSAQQAALMMSAAGRISHTPDSSWPWYTVEAAEVAYSSNLALGTSGPDAVTGYISDFGPNNDNVGHRRWLLYPPNNLMGNGDVPGDMENGLQPANVLRVIPEVFGERPPTRNEFVAWPPRGHVPSTLVFARWSFGHPDADFSSASVSMQSGGQSIPVSLEPVDGRFVGDPTLVWVPNGMNTNANIHWPTPEMDEVVEVTIANVLVDGSATEFSYTVTIFDPDQAGETEFPTTLTHGGPVIPTVPASFSVASRDWSEGVQGRVISALPYDTVHGGEAGLAEFEVNLSDAYNGIQNLRKSSGSAAFHLATPDHTVPQSLVLKDEFIIWPGPAQLAFASSLAWATGIQVASVQINTGSSEAWQTIWSQRGPVDANDTFTIQTIDLSAWEGKTARFRFRYEVDGLGSYWANVDGHSGWAIDEIALTGISRVTGIEELAPEMQGDSMSITLEDTEVVYLQARDIAFGGQPLDWGPITEVVPAWHTRVLLEEENWTEDPVLGWNYGGQEGWTFFLGLGWAYIESFPWIYTVEGWSYYLHGSIESGLWLYNSAIGHLYTRSAFGNWYQHEPFDDNSWMQFGG